MALSSYFNFLNLNTTNAAWRKIKILGIKLHFFLNLFVRYGYPVVVNFFLCYYTLSLLFACCLFMFSGSVGVPVRRLAGVPSLRPYRCNVRARAAVRHRAPVSDAANFLRALQWNYHIKYKQMLQTLGDSGRTHGGWCQRVCGARGWSDDVQWCAPHLRSGQRGFSSSIRSTYACQQRGARPPQPGRPFGVTWVALGQNVQLVCLKILHQWMYCSPKLKGSSRSIDDSSGRVSETKKVTDAVTMLTKIRKKLSLKCWLSILKFSMKWTVHCRVQSDLVNLWNN